MNGGFKIGDEVEYLQAGTWDGGRVYRNDNHELGIEMYRLAPCFAGIIKYLDEDGYTNEVRLAVELHPVALKRRIKELEAEPAKLKEPAPAPALALPAGVNKFDLMIGRLDRLLSEFLIEAGTKGLDAADLQTMKHHAEDLIGVGNAALDKLKKLGVKL